MTKTDIFLLTFNFVGCSVWIARSSLKTFKNQIQKFVVIIQHPILQKISPWRSWDFSQYGNTWNLSNGLQTQGLIQSKVFGQLRFNFAYYVCFPPVWQQDTLPKPDVINIFQSLHPFLEYSNLIYWISVIYKKSQLKSILNSNLSDWIMLGTYIK